MTKIKLNNLYYMETLRYNIITQCIAINGGGARFKTISSSLDGINEEWSLTHERLSMFFVLIKEISKSKNPEYFL